MAKTTAVSDEVYDLLQKARFPDESFSDVIKRSVKRRLKLTDIAGSKTLAERDWQEVHKVLQRARMMTLKELAKRHHRGFLTFFKQEDSQIGL